MTVPSTPLRIASGALVAAAVLVAAPASGLAGALHATKAATVQTKKVKKLGTILVNSKGRTLYMFVPDHRKKVTCKGQCAAVWPPLKVKKGQKPTAGGAAKQSLLGTDANPGGGKVVTYNHWPLYTYVGDTKSGQTNGQGSNLNGGKWYVLSPSGKIVKK